MNVPLKDGMNADVLPTVSIVDEIEKKYVSRIGNNMRISGFAMLLDEMEDHSELLSFCKTSLSHFLKEVCLPFYPLLSS